MTPKDPFLEGTFWDKFWRPIRSRALLFTPESEFPHTSAQTSRVSLKRPEYPLTQNYYLRKIILKYLIFEELRFSRVIPWKSLATPAAWQRALFRAEEKIEKK